MIEVGDWVQVTSGDLHNFKVGQIVRVTDVSDPLLIGCAGFVSGWETPRDGVQWLTRSEVQKIS